MAEPTISNAVGAPPAPNNPTDVRTVQTLLQGVQPPVSVQVSVNGTVDRNTLMAIREFQRRFMAQPDGRVDPDGRTLMHLNDGFSPSYQGCTPSQRVMIDRDMINAQKWIDTVELRLANVFDADMKLKVRNVFHIDVDEPRQLSRLLDLRTKYHFLRVSMDQNFPRRCETGRSLFAAWVDLNDPTGTMHFPPGHFEQSPNQRTETVIHERSHTIFKIGHGGMVGAGSLDFGRSAGDDNGFTYEQAISNGYCYGWLATALQPDYVPSCGEDVIVVTRRRP